MSQSSAPVRPYKSLTERERLSVYASMTPAERRQARWLIGQSSVEERLAGRPIRPQPSTAATRIRPRAERERRMRIQQGTRVVNDPPLTVTDLYIDGVVPPVLDTTRLHQQCGLCSHVKAHPVSYLCGHSHCYACVRLHLETDWCCPDPDCREIMQRPPHRHKAEELSLKLDYPAWEDTSAVMYSFDGLTFPKPHLFRTSYNLNPADDSE